MERDSGQREVAVWQDVSLAHSPKRAVQELMPASLTSGIELARLCLGGGQSYSLFIDKDELQRGLAVVYLQTYGSKGKQT